jgi:CDGSH-type Zn-finger protein
MSRQPGIGGRALVVVRVEAGELCTCKRTARPPICDNSHLQP